MDPKCEWQGLKQLHVVKNMFERKKKISQFYLIIYRNALVIPSFFNKKIKKLCDADVCKN